MTFYQFVRECLRKEAVRTEPDGQKIIQAVLKEIMKWKKKS